MKHPLRHLTRLLVLLPIAALPLAVRLAAADPADQAPDTEVVTLKEFDVSTTSQRDAYIASEATSGTRIGDKIVNQPYDVQVVTKELMRDFQMFSTDDQLAYVAGYERGDNASYLGGTTTGMRLEGFTPSILRNGFDLIGYPPDVSMTKQIEVIKGPTSTLYGDAQPGGLINYIVKRPELEPSYDFAGSFGTYDFRRFELDATGPLYKQKLYYLLVLSDTYKQDPQDYVYYRSPIANFSVTYQFDENTSITGSWEKWNGVSDRGSGPPKVVIGSKASGTDPLSRTGGMVVGWDRALEDFNEFGPNDHLLRNLTEYNILIEHRFSPDWSARLELEDFDKNVMENRWAAASFDFVTQHFDASQPFTEFQDIKESGLHFDSSGRFQIGPIKNALLISADYSRQVYRDDSFELPTALAAALPESQKYLDPYNPDWTPFNYSLLTRYTSRNLRDIREGGVLGSERMYFWDDRLILMGSLRFNTLEEQIEDLALNTYGLTNVHPTTYSYGANFKVLGDALVLFGNHSTSFDSNLTVDQGTGTVQAPEHGSGDEFGIKSAMLDERLDFTADYFDITKNNVSIANPSYLNPGSGIPQYLGAGVDRVKGLSVDSSFHVNDNLTVIGDFAYMPSKLVAAPTTPLNVGDELPFTPKYTFGGAFRYQFLTGSLKGWAVGVGTDYIGGYLVSEATATAYKIENPSVQLWNAFVQYQWKIGRYRMSLAYNIKNAFNHFYVDNQNHPNPGRENDLTVTFGF
jgi:outer membrane receptor protein involved in Fe transport